MPSTKTITPGSITTMLRKAKATYQRKKPDPKDPPEVRHLKVVLELKKLRDMAVNGGEDGEAAFLKKRAECVKRFKEHWKKLKTEKDADPNKAQLEKYRIVLGLLTLKVKALQYQDVKDAGSDEDETADPNALEMVDLSEMEAEETEEKEEEETAEQPVAEKPATSVPKVAPAKGSFVVLQQARLAWDGSRKKAAAEIKTLQAAILKAFQGDPDLPAAIDTAKDLQTRFDSIDQRLLDKLDEALQADGEQRTKLQEDAKGLLTEYSTFLNTDEMLKDVDDNPFVKVTVFKTLNDTLTMLQSRL